MELKTIAHFHSPFTSKFGIPKQSGLVEQLPGTITFEPRYRERNALRGIEEFDYLWLLWHFRPIVMQLPASWCALPCWEATSG